MSRALVSRDVFQLANVPGGLRPGTVSFKTVTLESDKYVAVRDMQPDNSTSVVLADLTRGVADRHNFKEPAESVLMHPVARVLALRFGTTLQIYKVDERTKVKESQFIDGAIVYWRWANATTLALVTDTAVYHWSADPSSAAPPQKIFDRAAGMGAEVQVLSYRVDAANKWFMLCGVARTDAGLLGKTQLYTAESNASRVIDGHTGCFAVVKGPNDPRECTVMCVAWSVAGQGGRLLIMELPNSSKPDITLERRNVNIPIDTPGDFPVAAHVSPRHKLLTIVTSRGSAILVDVLTGTVVSSEQVTQNVIFMGAPYEKTGGLLCVTNTGSLTHVSVDDDGICRYISNTLHNPDLAVRVASDAGLAGADDLFRTQLLNAVQRGDANAAIEAARASPRGSLRTAETLRLIQNMPAAPGQPPAISAYFKTMLAAGKLNVAESEELARVIIPKPNGYVYVKQQLDEDKLETSETLADLVAPQDADAALRMYHKVKAHAKVVNVLLGRNEVQNAVEYCRRAEYTPDWRVVLQNLIRVNPMDATNLALMLHNELAPQPVLDPIEVADMFVAAGQSETNVRAASKFIIDVLQGSRVGVAGPGLQTKLLEINLKFSRPEVAERIFSLPFMTQFDRAAIAPLCERANLWQAALDGYNTIQIESHYERSTMTNIKRCLAAGAASVPVEWLAEFFGRLRREDSIDALRELMKNSKGNFKPIVQIAVKYNDSLGSNNLINLLLETHAYDVMYYYLSSIITYVRDPEVHFRYIEAATEIGQLADVERMTRESPCYEPERTKNYLKEKNLDDLWPFVNVCDKHDFIPEMVKYLIDKNQAQFLEQYVQRRSPQKTPQVIGALIDLDAGEQLIKTVLTAAGSMVPVDELVKEVESRGRLRSLQQWLEQRAGERRTEPALHTALAKIYVDAADHTAENFLKQNSYYDARVVGEYCETRDPSLAFIAYEKGQCSSELVAVGKRNGMWRQLAKYLVKAHDEASWASVLQDVSAGPLSPQFVEAVRAETSQSDVAEEVITTVRAFMAADMMPELTVILDQVVTSGRFQRNKYLENLLLTSAIKSRPEKVGEYLNKLQDYDPKDIAPTAVQAGLFDAAFTIYHKAGMKREAIGVLLEHMHDISRARAYAQDAKDSGVFSVLGRYLLSKDELAEAIEALIEARNPEYVAEAMAAADRANQYGDLIKYLQMARRERKAGAAADLNIDTYLVLTFAKTGRMAELEEFLKGTTHNVQVVQVADKCFADGLYDSARALYTAASNFPKLASTYVRLRNFPAAVEAATKAQKTYTWKDVMVGCVLAEELALAQACAVPLTLQPDELPFVVNLYEEGGYLTELFALLKHSMVQQNAHKSVYTECAVLYAKYKPELLMEHIKLYAKKLNAHVVVNACVQHRHWLALRVLHIASEDWLAAAQTMLEHPAEAWEHELFKETISKMGNSDVCYNAIGFYLQHAPSKLHDFLTTVAKRIDTERVMTEVRRFAQLTFVRKFLESTQDRNVRRVNDALNSMYVEEEDFAALRRSVDSFNNFDSAELSARLEKLELFEFRKIALLLHRRNKRFGHAVEVAKANNLFQEAIDAAAESRDAELVEKLMRWFVVDKKRADCLAACLYVCYDLVPQHVVLELAWQYGMLDAAMPYLVQSSQELTERVAAIEKAMQDAQKHAKEAASHAATVAQHGGHAPLMITGAAAPGNMF